MSKILYIHNNDFHHLGRSQICAGAWYVFGPENRTQRRCVLLSPFSLTILPSVCGKPQMYSESVKSVVISGFLQWLKYQCRN